MSTTPPAAAAATGADAVALALSTYTGVTYSEHDRHVTGPKAQWLEDCSGIIQAIYAQLGVTIGGWTGAQVTDGTDIGTNLANALPGDIILYNNGDGGRQPGHEALYMGNDEIFQASHTGQLSGPAGPGSATELPIMDIRRVAPPGSASEAAAALDSSDPDGSAAASCAGTSATGDGGDAGSSVVGAIAYVVLLVGGISIVALGGWKIANPGQSITQGVAKGAKKAEPAPLKNPLPTDRAQKPKPKPPPPAKSGAAEPVAAGLPTARDPAKTAGPPRVAPPSSAPPSLPPVTPVAL